jgi:hypothetical protein
MSSIISIKSLSERRALIDLLDQAIALSSQLNRQLSVMGEIMDSAHEQKKAA